MGNGCSNMYELCCQDVQYYYQKEKLLSKRIYDNKTKNIFTKVIYGENGNIESECEYYWGKKHGVEKKYYSNGSLMCECYYVLDCKNGKEKIYHTNNKIKMITSYNKDEKNGRRKSYYFSGKLKKEEMYEGGVKRNCFTEYYENGKIKKEKYLHEEKKDKFENVYKCKKYYSNGVLYQKYSFIDGDDCDILKYIYIEYHGNGSIKKKLFPDKFEQLDLGNRMKFLRSYKSQKRNLLRDTLESSYRAYHENGYVEKRYDTTLYKNKTIFFY